MARKPDYELSLMDRKSGRKHPKAGGAWRNEDGSINIQLNPFITFTSDPDIIITLWPADGPLAAAEKKGGRQYRMGKPVSAYDGIDGNPEGPPWKEE
ncbi:MAG: hypothetical protein ACKOX6_00730 [Bdellovibrio sp.]